jgi:hypothetical protein
MPEDGVSVGKASGEVQRPDVVEFYALGDLDMCLWFRAGALWTLTGAVFSKWDVVSSDDYWEPHKTADQLLDEWEARGRGNPQH